MKGLAGLMLNGVRVVRQALHMAAETLIVLLKLLRLGLQIAQIMTLVLVGREAVFSKDNVVPHHNGQQRRGTCGQATAIAIKGIARAPNMGRESAKLGRTGRSFHSSQ